MWVAICVERDVCGCGGCGGWGSPVRELPYTLFSKISGTPAHHNSAPHHQVAPPVRFHPGLALDGVTYYRNLSGVLPQYGTFTLEPDPLVYMFDEKDLVRVLQFEQTKLEVKVRSYHLIEKLAKT